MIDIQDHIRNRGALNLFDGKGVKPRQQANTFTAKQAVSARSLYDSVVAAWKRSHVDSLISDTCPSCCRTGLRIAQEGHAAWCLYAQDKGD